MFQLKNLYFDIISRSWKIRRMWYLDYHGFEAKIRLSTGRSGTQTCNMICVRTGFFWRIKTFRQVTVTSRFEAGPSFDTFIQCLGSECG